MPVLYSTASYEQIYSTAGFAKVLANQLSLQSLLEGGSGPLVSDLQFDRDPRIYHWVVQANVCSGLIRKLLFGASCVLATRCVFEAIGNDSTQLEFVCHLLKQRGFAFVTLFQVELEVIKPRKG
jgi:hypothetical protein